MKVERFICFVIFCTVNVLFLAGCNNKTAVSHTDEGEPGVSYNAQKGLSIAPETADFIGLQLVDVEERTVPAATRFDAQVYQAAEISLASGLVDSATATYLHEGQPVTAQSGNGQDSFGGRITALKRSMELASGQVEVLLSISNGAAPLVLGQYVSTTAPSGKEATVTSVPRAAILHTAEGDFVYAVNGEHFSRTAVKLGSIGENFVEIVDGLYPGDRIVAQPVMTLWMAELQSLRGGESCADGH